MTVANGTATIGVTATGTGLTYQWYSGLPGSGTAVSGATDASVTPIAPGSYYVVVTAGCWGSATSSSVSYPPLTSGVDIPARFGAGALLATQTRPAVLGDNLNELNQLYGKSDGGNLRLGITGNITDGAGDGILILLDTAAGADGPLAYAPGDASARLAGLIGDTPDTGFTPDYAVDAALTGGVLTADLYDLHAATSGKTALGSLTVPGTISFTSGGEMSFSNANTTGVTATDASTAASASTGWEISLPLSRIGSPTGAVKVMALAQTASAHTNQVLPGLPDTYGVIPPGNLDYAAIPGRQFVEVATAHTPYDLPTSETLWAFQGAILNGGATVDSHPPIVSAPTIFNGRTYAIEDVEHTGGAHTGDLVAVSSATGILDATFGTNGRVALDAPNTGRVAIRGNGTAIRLYLATTAGTLYSMTPDGTDVHSLSLGGTTVSTPAVFFSSTGAAIYQPVKTGGTWYLVKVTDTETMALTGMLPLAGITDITLSPSLIQDGTQIQVGGATETGGVLYTITSDLHTPMTQALTTYAVKAPPTLSSDSRRFYAGDAPASGNGSFYCFDATTAAPVTGFGSDGRISVDGAVEHAAYGDYDLHNVTRGLYFATSTGHLYGVDPNDGDTLFATTPITVGPATGGVAMLNGRLYVPTAGGLYAIPVADPTTYVRYDVSSQASTPSASGRSAGSRMAVTGATGALYGAKLQ